MDIGRIHSEMGALTGGITLLTAVCIAGCEGLGSQCALVIKVSNIGICLSFSNDLFVDFIPIRS
jgi:hypothetical protein